MDRATILKTIKDKQTLYKFKQEQLNTVIHTKENINKQINQTIKLRDNVDNLIYATKLLLKKLVNTSKTNLEQFLTFALSRIFTDRDYQIRLELKEDSKKPGLDLMLVENGISQSITDSVGGGILSTLGLLLQIYYIEVYNLNKIMFIDEGLKEVSKADPSDPDSKDYLNDVLSFLKWLSKERGYSFVIVTHDQDVVNNADRVYRIKKGKVVV